MIILRIIILLLHFTLVPVVIGRLTTYRSSLAINHSPSVIYIVGFFGELAIMYAVNTVITFYQDFSNQDEPVKGCFTIICFVFGALLVVALLAYINKFLVGDGNEEEDDDDDEEPLIEDTDDSVKRPSFVSLVLQKIKVFSDGNKWTWIYLGVFLCILVFQCYFAYGYQINQWSYDDFDYVVHSNDNIANDMVDVTHYATGRVPSTSEQRQAASWTTFISYLSVVSGFDVATICHSCLTVLLLLVAYVVYFYIAKCLFETRENQMIFMCLLATAFMFGLYSHYSITFRLLCAIWQGKAVLSGIAIPFLIVYLPRVYKKKKIRNLFPLFVVSFGACSLTVMSTLLISITAAAMWVALSIYRRKPINVISTIVCGLGPILQVIIICAFKVFSI